MPLTTDEKLLPDVVDCVSIPSDGEDRGEGGGAHRSSVAMSIDTGAMQFKFDTSIDRSSESVELAAQLQMALDLLSRSDSRLEAALIEIGQLRAQVQMLREMQTNR